MKGKEKGGRRAPSGQGKIKDTSLPTPPKEHHNYILYKTRIPHDRREVPGEDSLLIGL
jgi:hypothetical protein